MLVPDNLRSAVTKACRYDPEINRSYQHMAEHFGCAILPTRPYKPKDKAKVEVGVQLVERWILMRLRHTTFLLPFRAELGNTTPAGRAEQPAIQPKFIS